MVIGLRWTCRLGTLLAAVLSVGCSATLPGLDGGKSGEGDGIASPGIARPGSASSGSDDAGSTGESSSRGVRVTGSDGAGEHASGVGMGSASGGAAGVQPCVGDLRLRKPTWTPRCAPRSAISMGSRGQIIG